MHDDDSGNFVSLDRSAQDRSPTAARESDRMPWLVKASVAQGQAVSKQYVPDISDIRGNIEDVRLSAYIGGIRALTDSELARIPKLLLAGKNSRGDVPAILGWSMGPFIVNERVREIIEELEPGVQNFHPITVRAKDGKPIKGRKELQYFIILQPPVLDCIADDYTVHEAVQRCGLLGWDEPITLKGSAVAGHHFWRATDPLHNNYFCSDELKRRLEAERLRGWAFASRCSVAEPTVG